MWHKIDVTKGKIMVMTYKSIHFTKGTYFIVSITNIGHSAELLNLCFH